MAHFTESFVLPHSHGALVFGMHWFPLLGGRPDKVGRRLARQHRSTHLVTPEGDLGAVGVVSLKARPRLKTNLYSAAQCVAQLFASGTVAVLLELENIGYWLVAIHEGAVVARTDQLYGNKEDADQVLDGLRQAYPQLQVLATPQADGLPSLDDLASACSSRSLLQPVRRWRSVMPWPVQWFVLALVMALLLPRAWQALHGAGAAVRDTARPDPVLAWRAAIASAGQQRIVHGTPGTQALLNTFYQLPTAVGGWLFRQADCVAQQHRWHCRARYERHGPEARNNSFLDVAPSAWTVEFASMDQVLVRWQIEAHGLPLARVNLPSSDRHERDLLSALQGIKGAFAQMQIGKPTPIALSAPTDEQGHALTRPAGLAGYMSRSVQITGPLRSASLLLPNVAAGAWEKVSLTLAQAEQPGLKSSRLNLSLQGVFYETDQPVANVPAAQCSLSGTNHCAG